MSEFSDAVVIVTGGGRGIGRRIAARFAEAGARVACVSRTEKELRETAALGGREGAIVPVVADVSRAEDVERAVERVEGALGPVDVLVNNAGVFLDKPLLKTTAEEWRRMMEVNVFGPFLLTRLVLAGMLERGKGRIINICSTASHRAYAGQSAYCASKHALLGMTKVLALETRGTGVRVHAVSPGGVRTALVRDREGVDTSQYMDPDEVAETVLFLAGMDGTGVIDEVVMRRAGAEPFR